MRPSLNLLRTKVLHIVDIPIGSYEFEDEHFSLWCGITLSPTRNRQKKKKRTLPTLVVIKFQTFSSTMLESLFVKSHHELRRSEKTKKSKCVCAARHRSAISVALYSKLHSDDKKFINFEAMT